MRPEIVLNVAVYITACHYIRSRDEYVYEISLDPHKTLFLFRKTYLESFARGTANVITRI